MSTVQRSQQGSCYWCKCVFNGLTGIRCELCEDGFYGDPLGWRGEVRPCIRCDCNENTDANAVGVCDHVTGRCLKCLGHTDGDRCEKCQSGYYGNALDRSLRPSQKCLRECVCMRTYIKFKQRCINIASGRLLCYENFFYIYCFGFLDPTELDLCDL